MPKYFAPGLCNQGSEHVPVYAKCLVIVTTRAFQIAGGDCGWLLNDGPWVDTMPGLLPCTVPSVYSSSSFALRREGLISYAPWSPIMCLAS